MAPIFALLALSANVMTVNQPVANLHSQPSEDSDVVTQAIYGVGVSRMEEQGGWLRVRTPDDYTGWMAKAAVVEGNKAYAGSGRVARVDSLFAHLYRAPSVTRRKPALTVPYETALEVMEEPEGEERRWVRVRLVDGGEAWVQRGDLTFRREPLTVEEAGALARRFLGLPYTWGGTSSFGYDCSGFTQMLYRRRGILMPRDAGPQSRWEGLAVIKKEELGPGDLLFFGPSAEKVTHTGYYLGSGQFIHASVHGWPRVQISHLEEPHWTRLLVGCRRPK